MEVTLMSKKIKRIIVTRTIVFDRQMFERFDGIKDDEQFINYVEDTVDDDFKYPVNFTQETSFIQEQ